MKTGIDHAIKEVSTKLAKIRENMVIDLMLRDVKLSEMTWVTDPSGKEWLCAPGYKIPAPTYSLEGTTIQITGYELKPRATEPK